MTHPWHPRKNRLLLIVTLLVVLAALWPFSGAAQEQPALTDLLDASALAVHGRVEKVLPMGRDRIVVTRFHVGGTIKGSPPGEVLLVAQELKFPSDRPSFHEGHVAILFLQALPDYSRWNPFRAMGAQYMPVGGTNGVKEMEAGHIADTAGFLSSYITLSTDRNPEGKNRYIAFLMDGLDNPLPAIQSASASALSRMAPIAPLLSKQDREHLVDFLRNSANSLDARRRLVRVVSGLEGFDTVIAQLAEEDPGIRFAALEALASNESGQEVRLDVIVACLKDPDPDVRLKALDLLTVSPGAEADNVLGALALGDSSVEIRARAISAMGKREGDKVKEIAPLALEDPSPFVVFVASDEIRKKGGNGAARTLGKLLEKDTPTIRFIGTIMLGALADEEARSILEETARTHPDPKTRDMALKILEGDAVDIDAVRRDLGVDEVLGHGSTTRE